MAIAKREDLSPMSIADELHKLQQLYQSGAINNDEYTLAKARLLAGAPEVRPVEAFPAPAPALDPAVREQETRQWAFILHMSVLAGFVIPIAGLVLPIMIWQLKKVELPGIDPHGKNVLNWIISEIIYAVACVILILGIIGIPLLIALAVVAVVFPIVAAIKANNGEVWAYPLAFRFVS
jgi:uncharacterized protein